MQVILLEKVHNVGDLGDVVKIKQGFARNFLIPQGKAKRATPENLKLLEEKRAELERAAGETLAHAQEQAAKIEGLTIQVTQKAGVDGRLFGSGTNVDIVEALQALGHAVEKAMIRMPDGRWRGRLPADDRAAHRRPDAYHRLCAWRHDRSPPADRGRGQRKRGRRRSLLQRARVRRPHAVSQVPRDALV
jgi:large subunit ribosomal protein L9